MTIVAIYRFTVSCIDQRDGLCLHIFTRRHIWSLSDDGAYMYDLNETV